MTLSSFPSFSITGLNAKKSFNVKNPGNKRALYFLFGRQPSTKSLQSPLISFPDFLTLNDFLAFEAVMLKLGTIDNILDALSGDEGIFSNKSILKIRTQSSHIFWSGQLYQPFRPQTHPQITPKCRAYAVEAPKKEEATQTKNKSEMSVVNLLTKTPTKTYTNLSTAEKACRFCSVPLVSENGKRSSSVPIFSPA